MNLPFDIQRQIALELEPYDLISFCASNQNINREICNSNEFWRLKMQKDFPEIWSYFLNSGMVMKQPKNTYIRNFIGISKIIEKETDRFMYRYVYTIGLKNHQDPYVIKRHIEKDEMFFNKINEIGLNNDQNVYEIKNKVYRVLYDSYIEFRRLRQSNDNINLKSIIDKNKIKHNLQTQLDLTDFISVIATESPLTNYYDKYVNYT